MTPLPDYPPHRVLVVVASRHGATRQIAETLAGILRAAGLDVDVQDAREAAGPAGYGAVVLGSAVYYGRWLAPARAFAEKHAAALADLPVWLFSSGPVGGAPKPDDGPAGQDAPGLVPTARGHVVFAGRIDRDLLGMRERLVTRAVGADDGDFRDWEEIAAWAAGIADELRVGAAQ
jgi:menaquinone-dependent protoporphyrinogen oxidase